MTNINPMLNDRRRPKSSSANRKKRSDYKADIRVPVSKEDYDFIKWNARSKKQSMTRFCTDVIRSQISMNQEFNEHPYIRTGFEVHIKPDEELYQKIIDYWVEWGYSSLREAAYRILTDSIFFIRGGIHFEGI